MQEFLWEIWLGRGNMHHRVSMHLNESPQQAFHRILQELHGTDKEIKTSLVNPNTGKEEAVQWQFSCRVKGEEWALQSNQTFAQQGVVEGAMLVVRSKAIRANTIYVDGYDGLGAEEMSVARSRKPMIIGVSLLLILLSGLAYYLLVLYPQERALAPYSIEVSTLPDHIKIEYVVALKKEVKQKDSKETKIELLSSRKNTELQGALRRIAVPKKAKVIYISMTHQGKEIWEKGYSYWDHSEAIELPACQNSMKCMTRMILKKNMNAEVRKQLKVCLTDAECGDGMVCKDKVCEKKCSSDADCASKEICHQSICYTKMEPFDAKELLKADFFPKELQNAKIVEKKNVPEVATHSPQELTTSFPRRWRTVQLLLDPMFGGKNDGQKGFSGTTAAKVNFEIAKNALKALRKHNRKIKSSITKNKDVDVETSQRIQTAQKLRNGFVVEIDVASGILEDRTFIQKQGDNEFNNHIGGFRLYVKSKQTLSNAKLQKKEEQRFAKSVKFLTCLQSSLKQAGFVERKLTEKEESSISPYLKKGIRFLKEDSILDSGTAGVRVVLGYLSHQKEEKVLQKEETHQAFASAISHALVCAKKK